jgi:nucleoside phosphorylase
MHVRSNWGPAVLLSIRATSVIVPLILYVADPRTLAAIPFIVLSAGWLLAAWSIDRGSTHDNSSAAEISPARATATIGIVTALPVEGAAIQLFVDDLVAVSNTTDPNRYHCGTMPSSDPARPHRVVIAVQARDGSHNAAALCTDMARTFPGLRTVVLCGIAAGVPTTSPIRLGDVASGTYGVVDYGHIRTVNGDDQLRRPTEGLSMALLRADHQIEISEYAGACPLRTLLAAYRARIPGRFAPPGAAAPRIHRGAIGSADQLLRDASRRDDIAARHDVIAIEMEASGVAAAAALHELHWYVVRGICDFADDGKDDLWHPFAALTAATYVRLLLANCEPT